MSKGFLIAATNSGAGKTTVSMGLMAALRRKNVAVQPFKVGPDYIDPSYHTMICGRPAGNLDIFMMGEQGIIDSFENKSKTAEISIVEGVMGLYDGMGTTEFAGAAHVAKTLDLPVILVVNTHGMSRSVAALIKGFIDYDKDVNVAGVILNKVGSPRHESMLREVLKDMVPVVGSIPRNSELTVPERYMGLYMPEENHVNFEIMADIIEENVDIDLLTEIAKENEIGRESTIYPECPSPDVTIGIAMDSAFCFYYYDMIDALKRSGARLIKFSPVAGEFPEADGYFFGSGYPEMYIEELAFSPATSKLKKAAEDGVPIYGEGGGLSYFCKTYANAEGKKYRMADILPAESYITKKLQGLGYSQAKPLIPDFKTDLINAHSYHYSLTEPDKDSKFAFEMLRGKGIKDKKDGLIEYETLAGYMQMHPASFPVDVFVNKCRKYKKGR
ncbi:MAG: cobyrinate a,c-diamide synthase [Methanosarcinaceae archaeon]|nr:cobyrinate a,c-diamide synthase [Methanosarcinaceae archaeon]